MLYAYEYDEDHVSIGEPYISRVDPIETVQVVSIKRCGAMRMNEMR